MSYTSTDPEVLHLVQLELECKALSRDGRLSRIPGDEPDDIELVQVVRYSSGTARIVLREDIDVEVAKSLTSLDANLASENPDVVVDALARRASWFRGRSYVFPSDVRGPSGVVRAMPDRSRAEDAELPGDRPLFAVMVAGERVSYCCSSRENDRAAEAWVVTEPAHRRRGYARRVVAAWASDVRRADKVAFYSHRDDNLASAGVARALGLIPWLSYVNFEPA